MSRGMVGYMPFLASYVKEYDITFLFCLILKIFEVIVISVVKFFVTCLVSKILTDK